MKMMSTSNCRNGLVCYDPVMKLREALDKLNRVKGLTHAEQGESESVGGKEEIRTYSCQRVFFVCLSHCMYL